MDDESAEIELLEQNLAKTRQISQRMTSKLEKTILPLYTSTQVLTRRGGNIEKALLKIDEVASNQEGVAAEEALILRGPQPNQLETYKDALERLNASIAFKANARDSSDTARLVETGAKKLAQLYTKLVAEGSSGSIPLPGANISSNPFPPSLLSTLRPLVSFLRTLPVPSTHPSHPAAPSIFSCLKEAQRGYADMRGTWTRRFLESSGKRILDRAETGIDPIEIGKEFGSWTQSVFSIARDEYDLLVELSAIPGQVGSSYTLLLNPVLAMFSTTSTSLVAFVKRSLHKYGFVALSAYEALLGLQPLWEEVARLRGSDGGRKESNEFRDALQTIKSLCLRLFPEVLADVKLPPSMASANKFGDTNTGILADTTTNTVAFLNRIPEVFSASTDILYSLGDGNWKMGEGVRVAKSAKTEAAPNVLEHYIYDFVCAAVSNITTVADTQRRPPFGTVFRLNNIAYLRKHIVLDPQHDALIDYLSKPTQEVLNSNFRTAKSAYFDANFSPLMQALTDDPKEKGKTATKEKFTRFYDLLDEVLERHRMAPVLEDDEESREQIGSDVIKFVIPSLKAFTQKHKEKEFSKNPQKYIKMPADEVENRLKSIYR
ncbi:hypothetical protein K435DRAFT_729547 [Dendrothele bispora CBS 962.96]|uniref:Exocyst complex protein EXO70 n=1 Tax=Dendrothele bispora (strain CBS 962.96) TaxID=1314807 RepID=A0A4V4HDZ3_DENBC|nr:hypothetical protein K435DRAFT_729547 [Dendrothele bispora CBS 962.96]